MRIIEVNSSVMRIGITTGVRVPMRMTPTDGTLRKPASTRSSAAVGIVNGSPPETMTSWISGCAVR